MEKDAIFARLEAARASEVARPGWLRSRRFQAAVGAFAALAVAAVVVIVRPRPSHEASGEVTARGSADVTLVVRCGAREPGDCAIGDRVVFDFGSMRPAGYVALFARSPGGEVIWYLPTDETRPSIPLSTNAASGVLDTVAVIDASYATGRYELFAVLSAEPLSRADIRGFARGDDLVPPAGVRIERRAFAIRGEESVR